MVPQEFYVLPGICCLLSCFETENQFLRSKGEVLLKAEVIWFLTMPVLTPQQRVQGWAASCSGWGGTLQVGTGISYGWLSASCKGWLEEGVGV